MRYSIMVQLVTGITLILLGAAALFAWVQTRTAPTELKGTTSSQPDNDR